MMIKIYVEKWYGTKGTEIVGEASYSKKFWPIVNGYEDEKVPSGVKVFRGKYLIEKYPHIFEAETKSEYSKLFSAIMGFREK